MGKTNSKKWKLLIGLSLVLFFLSATTTYATIFGNYKWAHVNGTTGQVVVSATNSFMNNSTWSGQFNNGRNLWNNSSANINVRSVSSSNANLNIYTVSGSQWNNNGWGSNIGWAQSWNGNTPCNNNPNQAPTCSSGNRGNIYLNNALAPSAASNRAAIIAHEIGHIIGLAHVSGNNPSIMAPSFEDPRFRSTVQSYDVTQFNRLY